MNYFERFKLRWNIHSNRQLVIVFVAFGLTGFCTLGVKKLLLPLFGISSETPLYLRIIAEVLIILPAYQVLLIVVGSLLGQYKFFKGFLRKMFFLDRKKAAKYEGKKV
jgi:ferrochelatase